MQEFLLSPIPLTELELMVENSIKRALEANTSHEDNLTEIINRDELCKRLNITEPTVIKWEKKGKIPSIRIGGTVRYNWYTVIAALENKKGRK